MKASRKLLWGVGLLVLMACSDGWMTRYCFNPPPGLRFSVPTGTKSVSVGGAQCPAGATVSCAAADAPSVDDPASLCGEQTILFDDGDTGRCDLQVVTEADATVTSGFSWSLKRGEEGCYSLIVDFDDDGQALEAAGVEFTNRID